MRFLILPLIFLCTSVSAGTFQCTALGTVVKQIPVSHVVLAKLGTIGGAAIQKNGKPVTLYDKSFSKYPETFLNQVLAHECAHHQLGHNFLPLLDKYETAADCHSLFLLENQMNYSKKDFVKLFDIINIIEGKQRAIRLMSCNRGL